MADIQPRPAAFATSLYNVFDVGKVPYVAANAPVWTLYQRAVLYALTSCRLLAVFLFSLPWFVLDAVYLIVPRPKKNVYGQTALVTGGGNGIGKAIALRLAQEGCNIAVVDLDAKAAERVVAELKQLNVDAHAYVADVSDAKAIDRMREKVQREMGSVDILVNNAGYMSLMSVRDGTVEQLDRMIRINLHSHFYTIRAFLPDMIKRRRGHIVGMSSMSGIHPTPNLVIYTAAKHGIYGLMEGLAAELRQEGLGELIRFTTVHPYFVSTRQDILDAVRLRYPPVTPERVANETVLAMLRNETAISVPRYLFFTSTIFRLFAAKAQGFVRDHLLCESEVKLMLYQNNATATGKMANDSNGNGKIIEH